MGCRVVLAVGAWSVGHMLAPQPAPSYCPSCPWRRATGPLLSGELI